VVFVVLVGDISIGTAAHEAIFFIGEENAADGSFGLVAGFFEDAEDFHGVDAAGAVVVSALGDIPGVEVSAHEDNIVGEFASANFADDVVVNFIGEHLPVGLHKDPDGFIVK